MTVKNELLGLGMLGSASLPSAALSDTIQAFAGNSSLNGVDVSPASQHFFRSSEVRD